MCDQWAFMKKSMQLRFTAIQFFMRYLWSYLFQAFLKQDFEKLCAELQTLVHSVSGIILSLCTMWHVALIGAVLVVGCIYYLGDKIVDKTWDQYNIIYAFWSCGMRTYNINDF